MTTSLVEPQISGRPNVWCFCPTGTEKSLQARLSSISGAQLAEGQEVQNVAAAADDIRGQQQTFRTKMEEVQTLMEDLRRRLGEAQRRLGSVVRGRTSTHERARF